LEVMVLARTNEQLTLYLGLMSVHGIPAHVHGDPKVGVALKTVHCSKGTESDCVFLIGASDNHFCDDGDDRLLYVAVTRARLHLHISFVSHAQSQITRFMGEGALAVCQHTLRLKFNKSRITRIKRSILDVFEPPMDNVYDLTMRCEIVANLEIGRASCCCELMFRRDLKGPPQRSLWMKIMPPNQDLELWRRVTGRPPEATKHEWGAHLGPGGRNLVAIARRMMIDWPNVDDTAIAFISSVADSTLLARMCSPISVAGHYCFDPADFLAARSMVHSVIRSTAITWSGMLVKTQSILL
jgi:hypothetical protein